MTPNLKAVCSPSSFLSDSKSVPKLHSSDIYRLTSYLKFLHYTHFLFIQVCPSVFLPLWSLFLQSVYKEQFCFFLFFIFDAKQTKIFYTPIVKGIFTSLITPEYLISIHYFEFIFFSPKVTKICSVLYRRSQQGLCTMPFPMGKHLSGLPGLSDSLGETHLTSTQLAIVGCSCRQ